MSGSKSCKITRSARNHDCWIAIPLTCNSTPETTVWCHSNRLRHGKGVGKKSLVIFGAYGCSSCHDVYDRRAPPPAGMEYSEVDEYFGIGHDRSLVELLQKGLVICL